jgi:galactokinase
LGSTLDYNGGLVLPAPLPLQVHVRVEPADAHAGANAAPCGGLRIEGEPADARSLELACAVCAELGVDDALLIATSGDLPAGAGLARPARAAWGRRAGPTHR